MQKIFISGGTRGIGLEIGKRFHKAGFKVIICARGKEGLEKVQQQFPDWTCYQCDISKKDEVKSLAKKVNEEYGALDVLVNNGGTYKPGMVHTEEDEVFEMMMTTNLNSAYYLTKGVIPGMLERKKGTIFNICSIAGLQAYPNGGSYSISKFALHGFSMNLREELKDKGIRVISIHPGAVWTSSWEGSGVEEERIMPAQDIASMIWNAWEMSDRTVIEEIVCRPQLGDL